MKKLVTLFLAIAFILGIGYTANAATAKKVVVKKKVVAKKVVKKPVVKKAAPKKAMPAPAPVAPAPPPPPPVAPAPAPVVAPAGLFGMGMNTLLTGTYLNTGKGSLSGSVGAMGSMVLDDFVGLGSMVGLGAKSINYTVGLGAFYGGGGLKAIPVRAGGIITLPKEWMGGLESYLAGGLNYVVYGNKTTSGSIGGDAAIGMKVDLGLGLGKTGIELGYTVVRSNTKTSKGLSLSVSQPIVL
jgi:hypothetical protein